MNPRLKVGKGVSGAIRYVLGEGRDHENDNAVKMLAPGQESRVAWVSGTGCGFPIRDAVDVEIARRLMEHDAANQGPKSKDCEQDCVHLMLGWARGETPTREDMEAAAHGALKSLGMENARAIFVSHSDEDYAHVHVVASRLNPETGLSYDLDKSQRTLSRFAEKYERDHGGLINLRRADANELRAAIAARDPGAVLDSMVKQRATFTPKQLEAALGKEIKNELGRAFLGNEVLSHANIVALSDTPGGPVTRYSTKDALEAERYALAATTKLSDQKGHEVAPDSARSILARDRYKGMTAEQEAAFWHVIGDRGIALIDGQAGTGKTAYPVSAARDAYEAVGFRVIGLGPTNKVANALGESGFATSSTVQKELSALTKGETKWNNKTVVIVDEAAMLDTKTMAQLATRAAEAGAKLIMVGDDRQLSSIDRGGLYGVFKDRYGAAEITEVRRQNKTDERRASEMMAQGNFDSALRIYDAAGAIHWTRTQPEAREALVKQWAKDSAADPGKSRLVFAYTNEDVGALNASIRKVREERGELGAGAEFSTKHGRATFAEGDRVQFTEKEKGIINGAAGTVERIEGSEFTVKLDGKKPVSVTFDASDFKGFRHGYAGTIYRGQGDTLDQTYLFHSEHWRASSGFVALTRHRDKTEIFVARNTLNFKREAEPWMMQTGGAGKLSNEHKVSAEKSYATWKTENPALGARYGFENYVGYVQTKWAENDQKVTSNDDIRVLARQMGRTDDRRAASAFHSATVIEPLRPRTADQLAVDFAPAGDTPFSKEKIKSQIEQRDHPQLGQVASNIRQAWTTTKGAEDFAEALAVNGMSIARVSAHDAAALHRRTNFAKEVGNRPPRQVAEGDLVVTNLWGSIYQLDTRLTGSTREEIAQRVAGFDGVAMLSVGDTRDVLRDVSRAARAEQREKDRPATPVELKITEALRSSQTGTDFAIALDNAGLTIAKGNGTDQIAVGALRDADETARILDKEMSGLTLPKQITHDGLYAVTPRGHVFALNPHKLDFADIEDRLADTQKRMPSIVEARAHNEQKRADKTELWAKRRADALDRRISNEKTRKFKRNVRTTVRMGKRTLLEPQRIMPNKAANVLSGAALAVLGALELIANMFSPPPPLTRDQKERRYRSRLEQAETIERDEHKEEHLRAVNEPPQPAPQDWNQRHSSGTQERDFGRERERTRDRD